MFNSIPVDDIRELFTVCKQYDIVEKWIYQRNMIMWSYLRIQKIAYLEFANDICLISDSIMVMNMKFLLYEKATKVGLRTKNERNADKK